MTLCQEYRIPFIKSIFAGIGSDFYFGGRFVILFRYSEYSNDREGIEMYYWFLFYKDKVLLEKVDGGYGIPFGEQAPIAHERDFEIAFQEDIPARAASVEDETAVGDDYCWVGLRASWDYLPREWYKRAGKAFQLVHWDRNSRYCPACGRPLSFHTLISKYCDSCRQEYYPVITPAIIVLIRRGEEVLLVHARNFKGSFHGLVAGFLEVGETLEQCVCREVYEETGLRIRNLTYFGSQPWPYPSGLMVGFFADYDSGTIKLQDDELSAGSFFTKENLPELPQKLSIARRMIDWWLAGEQGDKPAF